MDWMHSMPFSASVLPFSVFNVLPPVKGCGMGQAPHGCPGIGKAKPFFSTIVGGSGPPNGMSSQRS
jgi:hypothetical protein